MDLCRAMARTRVKGNGSKGASSPETEPNFYKMPPASETGSSSNSLQEFGGPSIVSVSAESSHDACQGSPNNVVPVEVEVPYDALTSLAEGTNEPGTATSTPLPQSPSQMSLPLVSPVIEGKKIISIPSSPMPLQNKIPMPSDLFDFGFGVHSGDMLHFEGLPFHYLETKDVEESLIMEI